LNKAELVTSIAEKSALSKKDAEKALEAITESITETLASGEKVLILGFGTFETRDRASREGINPQTGEKITVKASRVPVFRSGKDLKTAVNVKK